MCIISNVLTFSFFFFRSVTGIDNNKNTSVLISSRALQWSQHDNRYVNLFLSFSFSFSPVNTFDIDTHIVIFIYVCVFWKNDICWKNGETDSRNKRDRKRRKEREKRPNDNCERHYFVPSISNLMWKEWAIVYQWSCLVAIAFLSSSFSFSLLSLF